MKKLTGTVVVLALALTLYFAGSILQGVNQYGADGYARTFNLMPLARAFTEVGLIAAVLSGIVLVALTVICAAKNTKEIAE